MTRIHFHEDFYEPIRRGEKTQTARLDEPVYPLGDAVADFSDGRSLPIQITKVSCKCFRNVSPEEVRKDGFESKEELWGVLQGFYPNIQDSDFLMLVEFRCTTNDK
ncbi:MAG: ASCH domain-containing protein [Marinifilaceae bacterium]